MSDVINIALLKQAVERANHMCNICGAPCKNGDARRRIDPGPQEDVADNWTAMCGACRDWLDGKAPPPARYVAHIYDAPTFRRRIRKAWGWGLAFLALGSWLALAGIVGWLIKNAIDSPLDAFISAVSILFLITLAGGIWSGWRGRKRYPDQHIHHTHDFSPQTVLMKESR